jgi:uncharacterized OB-fold protein
MRPLPQAEGLAAEFYGHCAQGRLCFQRCTSCGTWRHLPRVQCARCGSADWEWAASSGRGRIHSWTVTHQAPYPPFAADVPYAVIVVELDEGVRMVSGLRELALDRIELDLPVEVVFESVNDRMAIPFFRPCSG